MRVQKGILPVLHSHEFPSPASVFFRGCGCGCVSSTQAQRLTLSVEARQTELLSRPKRRSHPSSKKVMKGLSVLDASFRRMPGRVRPMLAHGCRFTLTAS